MVDALLEIQRVWEWEGARFDPGKERAVRRHIGDYTLFMTGLFREHVERLAVVDYYEAEGRRAYRFLAEPGPSRGRARTPPFREARSRVRALCRSLDLYPKSLLPRHAAALARARRAVTRPALEAALAGGPLPDLTAVPADVLEAELREAGAAASAPAPRRCSSGLADGAPDKCVRKSARRALYRLGPGRRGIGRDRRRGRPPAPSSGANRSCATAAWLSGIDGSGSRAA